MKHPLLYVCCAYAALLAGCGRSDPSAATRTPAVADRYSLANGCYAMRDEASGLYVQRSGDGYALSADEAQAEPFFFKPSALGRYLIYGHDASFVAALPRAQGVTAASAADESADWTIDGESPRYTIRSDEVKANLVATADRTLGLADSGGAFTFAPAQGCAAFPEIPTNASGETFGGRGADRPVIGFADSHLHITATDFLGGTHYGRPFHRFGVTEALKNCEVQHGPNGTLDLVGNLYVYGNPLAMHETQGWPTFHAWPSWQSLTHEQTYYKWLERAWLSGERLIINFLVQNETLCHLESTLVGLSPLENCNEMDAARLQVRQIHDLQDYIDAQEGGPGKGWFRLVDSPAEARRVINQGKLAVVLGIENSHLFDCALKAGIPQCDKATIDRELDEFHAIGVRTVFPIHEFNNALGGNGLFNGLILNVGNFLDTGSFWQTYDCPDEPYLYTAGTKLTGVPLVLLNGSDPLSSFVQNLINGLPVGLPVYDTSTNQCNNRSLTELGRYLVQRLMEKKVMIEVDHMELKMKGEVLDIAEAQTPVYPVMSSHGGHGGLSIEQAQRIYRLGGLIYDYKGNGQGYVAALEKTRPLHDDRYFFGFGFGADTNGMGTQARPRDEKKKAPVQYPFTLFRGADWGPQFAGFKPVTFDRQQSGERVFDTDNDGFAHYGMMADFVEEVRLEGGQPALDALYNSAEAYLQMWEHVENR
ncbi:MAG: peptidase M19 [Solimonas sp.]